MKILCDTPEKKNQIGKEIAIATKKIINDSIIVSPYISDLEKYIDLSKIKKLRIICNAESASCNPYTLQNLLKNKNVQIKSKEDIHAKVYIFDETAFIGSANATNNGLGKGTIEASIQTQNESLIEEIKEWFMHIWNNSQSQDISEFDRRKWEELKSHWSISNINVKEKQSLYDLIITKTIPKNTSFAFWHETKEKVPDKSEILSQVKEEEEIIELPDNAENWDFWIEDGDYSENNNVDQQGLEILKEQLKYYYNHVMINLKTSSNDNRVFYKECFSSKMLDKPIVLRWNNKDLLLSLYRKDNINSVFSIDKKTIDLLNLSKQKNKEAWDNYLSSTDGQFRYCSSEKIYELINNCFI